MRSLWSYLFSNPSQLARRIDVMRTSEASLMEYAFRFGKQNQMDDPDNYQFHFFDTKIPKSSITALFPSSQCLMLSKQNDVMCEEEDANNFIMHGVKVQKKLGDDDLSASLLVSKAPLVLLHGYANGALYFYRNLIGLADHFTEIFSLDLLGWGLSSRPPFVLQNKSVETAESFFVESLEQWRQKHGIEKMILAGHSMGGYISIAYCEKYPQHVERLVLISPVGVPHVDEEQENDMITKRMKDVSMVWKMTIFVLKHLFENDVTPGAFLRALPESRAKAMVSGYVKRRLPAITCEQEQQSLIDYLYTNSILPGSGEYALNRILKPMAFAHKPTVYRIPNLNVPHVTFIYGENDWMDLNGGLDVQRICEDDNNRSVGRDIASRNPSIDVLVVKNAGHLLMLENWEEFNTAILDAAFGENYVMKCLQPNAPRPLRLHHSKYEQKNKVGSDAAATATSSKIASLDS